MTNQRFEELEKRAKKVQVKQVIARILILSILVIVAIFFWWYFLDDKTIDIVKDTSIKKELHVREDIASKEASKSYEPITVNKSKKEEVKEVKTKITSLKKEDNSSEKTPPYETIFLFFDVTFEEKNSEKVDTPIKKTPSEASQTQKEGFNMEVREVKSKEALIERFNSANDYASALALTKIFFEESNFNKTVYWSKIASKLKPSAPTPWILFAKAKKKQGDIKSAKKALELYLEYFNNKEVQKLLKHLEEDR